mmetsp:Transcript_69066/g.150910  ORF Transcript_69066/g.150910 Transcript_69066/m.150910 type:complete len:568 (-) Transcript_69066:83-1786(-)
MAPPADISIVRSPRFEDPRLEQRPGPGTYELATNIVAPLGEGKAPAFQHSDFTRSAVLLQASGRLGPGSYKVLDPAVGRSTKKLPGGARASFLAPAANVFEQRQKRESRESPGPGSYDPSSSKHDWRPHAPPRGDGSWLERGRISNVESEGATFLSPSTTGDIANSTKGTDFHSSKWDRTDAVASKRATPGPGSYGMIRTAARTCTAWSRDNCERSDMGGNTPNPGPGTYSFSTPSAATGTGGAALRGRTARWSGDGNQGGPGPGTYNKGSRGDLKRARSTPCVARDPQYHGVHEPWRMRELLDTQGGHLTAFNTREERFPEARELDAAFGSSRPELSKGQSIEANVKSHGLRRGLRRPFGSNVERFRARTPDPCAEPKPLPEPRVVPNRGSGMKSKTERITKLEPSSTPSPGDYELPGAFQKVDRSAKPWHRPRTAQVCFGRITDRWDGQSGIGPSRSLAPGPGTYEPPILGKHSSGVIPSQTTREHTIAGSPPKVSAHPGPGSYEVSKSLLRPTFNSNGEAYAKEAFQVGCARAAPGKKHKMAHALMQLADNLQTQSQAKLAHTR